jgi:hypothetical protein
MANYFGSDSFTYSVSDGVHSVSQVVAVTVTDVAEINLPPVPTFVALTMVENTSRFDTLTATDPEGNTLSFAKVANPAHGTLLLCAGDGSFAYSPTAGYVGSDSFTYSVSDGVNTVNQVVAITVTS